MTLPCTSLAASSCGSCSSMPTVNPGVSRASPVKPSSTPAMIRSSDDLPAPFGPEHADLGPGVEREGDVLQHLLVGRVEPAHLAHGEDELRTGGTEPLSGGAEKRGRERGGGEGGGPPLARGGERTAGGANRVNGGRRRGAAPEPRGPRGRSPRGGGQVDLRAELGGGPSEQARGFRRNGAGDGMGSTTERRSVTARKGAEARSTAGRPGGRRCPRLRPRRPSITRDRPCRVGAEPHLDRRIGDPASSSRSGRPRWCRGRRRRGRQQGPPAARTGRTDSSNRSAQVRLWRALRQEQGDRSGSGRAHHTRSWMWTTTSVSSITTRRCPSRRTAVPTPCAPRSPCRRPPAVGTWDERPGADATRRPRLCLPPRLYCAHCGPSSSPEGDRIVVLPRRPLHRVVDARGVRYARGRRLTTPPTTISFPGALGLNAWLVDEMHEQYLADPTSVSETGGLLRRLPARRPPGHGRPATRSTRPAGPRPATRRRTPATTSASGHHPPPAAGPAAASPGEPIRGAAARIVANMEASLEVPTATSFREVPAKLLEVNRRVINGYLGRTRGGKVSFTHLIGFAVVRAIPDTGPGHELDLRRGRRRQAPRRPPRARRPRHRRRRREGRRQPHAARPGHQGRRHPRLPGSGAPTRS